MTNATVLNLFGRYLEAVPREERIKELPEVTCEDMIKVYKDECETARDLEIERQTDEMLILAENN